MNNREILLQIAYEHCLTRKQLAELMTGRSGEKGIPIETLNGYLLPNTSKAQRNCSDLAIKLLKDELEVMK